MTDIELYKTMLDKYGGAQVVVAIEELSELTKELTKYLRHKGNPEHIAEEIGDVEIMLSQMRLKFNLSTKVEDYKRSKHQRMHEQYIRKTGGGDE